MARIRMTGELRDRWTAALRSGNYKQTTSALCEAHGDGTKSYCCLGVLAEITGTELVPVDTRLGAWGWANDDEGSVIVNYEDLNGLIDGFPEGHQDDDDLSQRAAMSRNDDWAWSFDQIADWLDTFNHLPSEKDT